MCELITLLVSSSPLGSMAGKKIESLILFVRRKNRIVDLKEFQRVQNSNYAVSGLSSETLSLSLSAGGSLSWKRTVHRTRGCTVPRRHSGASSSCPVPYWLLEELERGRLRDVVRGVAKAVEGVNARDLELVDVLLETELAEPTPPTKDEPMLGESVRGTRFNMMDVTPRASRRGAEQESLILAEIACLQETMSDASSGTSIRDGRVDD